MKFMKKNLALILLLITTLVLCGCEKDNLSFDISETGYDSIVQGADDSGDFSAGESGVFKLTGNHLKYFDYKSQKEYIICNRPNCRHDDASCSGWFNGNNGARGLAEYCGKIYCFFYNIDENNLELVKMERDGSKRKVISKIRCGDFKKGNWNLEPSCSDVYYTNGIALIILDWLYFPTEDPKEAVATQQCVAIDIESGKITEVTEKSKEEVICNIDGLSNEYCIVNTSGAAEKLLNKKEFYRAFEAGEFDNEREIKDAENPYEAYYQSYSMKIPNWIKFILYDISENESKPIYEGYNRIEATEYGSSVFQPFYVSGIYGDTAIIENFEIGNIEDENDTGVIENTVYKWDFINDRKEVILDINDGYMFDAGGLTASCILDGNKILFLKRKPDLKADYYSYNLETCDVKKMYEGDRNVPYRIVGENSDSFLYYTYDGYRKKMYMINKDDYIEGLFAEAVRIKGLDEKC